MALSNSFGDSTYTKVFVGGLAWETQSDTIRCHFEQFGEILEAVVISDKLTGRSKGYGFVTFCDPESARKACADPNPVIDGRKANCNLASLGRFQSYFPYGCIQPIPYFGMPQMPRGSNIGSPSFQQPGPAGYQAGIACPSYGYMPYGPEFVYPPQGVYNPYMGQHYGLVYGPAGPINTSIGPFGQMGASLHGTIIQGFVMPNLNVPQYVGPPVGVLTTDTTAAIQTPCGQPRMYVPGHPPQFTWNRSSNQTTG